jgi:hypothetical protein
VKRPFTHSLVPVLFPILQATVLPSWQEACTASADPSAQSAMKTQNVFFMDLL